MTDINLAAIRARDADYNDVFEAQASMSKDIAHRLVAWPVADRRALLAYVDDLHRMRDVFRVEYDRLLAEYDALAVAARKVTGGNCANDHWGVPRGPCPDCADLRAILEGEK